MEAATAARTPAEATEASVRAGAATVQTGHSEAGKLHRALIAALPAPEPAGARKAVADQQQFVEFHQSALHEVFLRLPHNSIVLTTKVLSKGWRDWVYQQLGQSKAKSVLICCDDDPQSSYVPLWALKQQGLHIKPRKKAGLAIAAAARRELEDLQWMIQHSYLDSCTCFHIAKMFRLAALGGDLEMVQVLASEGLNIGHYTCAAAARGGQLEVLKWLMQNQRGAWNPWLLCAAIAGGPHMHVISWALDEGCPVDASVCTAAAAKGDLPLLQQLRARGVPWDEDTCAAAAKGGHLMVLQWLLVEGCPWDEFTCQQAARYGKLELLQWARNMGCPWTKACVIQAAARGGYIDVLQWLLEEGCPWESSIWVLAIEYDHLDLLKWVVETVGRPWESNEENYPLLRRSMETARKKGNLGVLQWISNLKGNGSI
jgi:hypothetical protein